MEYPTNAWNSYWSPKEKVQKYSPFVTGVTVGWSVSWITASSNHTWPLRISWNGLSSMKPLWISSSQIIEFLLLNPTNSPTRFIYGICLRRHFIIYYCDSSPVLRIRGTHFLWRAQNYSNDDNKCPLLRTYSLGNIMSLFTVSIIITSMLQSD